MGRDEEHTSRDQLLHLASNGWVLHMVLQRRRVALGLLQNTLHDWVLQDSHDVGVLRQ